MWHEAQRKQLGAKVATCAVQHVQRCRALAQLLHRKGVDNAIGTALDKLLAEIGRMEVASAARTTRPYRYVPPVVTDGPNPVCRKPSDC